jgi:hypothetical protein
MLFSHLKLRHDTHRNSPKIRDEWDNSFLKIEFCNSIGRKEAYIRGAISPR